MGRLMFLALVSVGFWVTLYSMPGMAEDAAALAPKPDQLKELGGYAAAFAYMLLEAWLGKTTAVTPGSVLGVGVALLKGVLNVFRKKDALGR